MRTSTQPRDGLRGPTAMPLPGERVARGRAVLVVLISVSDVAEDDARRPTKRCSAPTGSGR